MKYIKKYNESIRHLLKPKSEENIKKSLKNMSKKNQFLNACKYGTISIIKELLKTDFDPSFNNNQGLTEATIFNNDNIIKILLKDERVIKQLYKFHCENMEEDEEDEIDEYDEDID